MKKFYCKNCMKETDHKTIDKEYGHFLCDTCGLVKTIDTMPISAVTWSVSIFAIIIILVGLWHFTRPKIIKPSGPGTCDVSCCIELIGNSDLAFDIKNSRLEIK